MTAPLIDWGPIDPADWQPEPPAGPSVNMKLAWVFAAKKILDDRVGRLECARLLARRATDALIAAKEEVDAAIDLVTEAVREAEQ